MSTDDDNETFRPSIRSNSPRDMDDLEKERIDRENEAFMRKQAERKRIDVTKLPDQGRIKGRKPKAQPQPLPTDHDLAKDYPRASEPSSVIAYTETTEELLDEIKAHLKAVHVCLHKLKNVGGTLTNDELLSILNKRMGHHA